MPEQPVPKHAVDSVREVLVAFKSEAGIRASWITHAALDRAARPIARLIVRLVDAAVAAHLADKENAA